MSTFNGNGEELESISRTVQELSSSHTPSLLQKYIQKDGIGGPKFPVLDNIPVLDLSLITSTLLSSPETETEREKKELERLRFAFESCGYIQVVNHGMEDSLLDEIHGVTREFFGLPMEEKKKCARLKDSLEGYGNDPVYSDRQILDWNDRLSLTVKPDTSRNLKLWPQNPLNFRKVLEELSSKVEEMNEVMLRAMAKCLKLEDEDCFIKQFGENPNLYTRFNYYPPCPRPDAVLAAKAHGDAFGLTYLLQDKNVDSLQTIKDGHWYTVPFVPKSILVIVGDQVEIMSNGIFKSPVHRVVTNPRKERITIAIFCSPEITSEIGPVEALIDEKTPRAFKNVVHYLKGVFRALQLGIKPIDQHRI